MACDLLHRVAALEVVRDSTQATPGCWAPRQPGHERWDLLSRAVKQSRQIVYVCPAGHSLRLEKFVQHGKVFLLVMAHEFSALFKSCPSIIAMRKG
jgi:hypothetical protein